MDDSRQFIHFLYPVNYFALPIVSQGKPPGKQTVDNTSNPRCLRILSFLYAGRDQLRTTVVRMGNQGGI